MNASRCPVFRDQPTKVDSVTLVQETMELVDSIEVCIGNPEDYLLDVWHHHMQMLH